MESSPTSSLPAWLRRTSKIFAIIYGGLAVLSILPAGMSPMMFDAPGSESSPLTIALVCGIAAAPFVLGGSAVALVIVKRRRGAAFGALLMPATLVAYLTAVVVLLERWCGGSFTCK